MTKPEIRIMDKHQIPSTKYQTMSKFQIPNGVWDFGYWDLFGF